MIKFFMSRKQIYFDLGSISASKRKIHTIDAILSGILEDFANKVKLLTTLERTGLPENSHQLLRAEIAITDCVTSKGKIGFGAPSRCPKITCGYCGRDRHGQES